MSKMLAGKVAIITGANQGLGLEISKKYLEAGADLMICARNAELLEKARQELMARGGARPDGGREGGRRGASG